MSLKKPTSVTFPKKAPEEYPIVTGAVVPGLEPYPIRKVNPEVVVPLTNTEADDELSNVAMMVLHEPVPIVFEESTP
jgi:hypothetical protein